MSEKTADIIIEEIYHEAAYQTGTLGEFLRFIADAGHDDVFIWRFTDEPNDGVEDFVRHLEVHSVPRKRVLEMQKVLGADIESYAITLFKERGLIK